MRKSLKITTLFILLAILSIAPCWAQQNLVPNPSFEDTVQCPTADNQVNLASGWNDKSASPDYFHSCSDNFSVPINWGGYQSPATGNAYCALGTYANFKTNTREFIQAKLSKSLDIGEKYYVSLKISLSISDSIYANCATNNIGAFLSTYSYNYDVFTDNLPDYAQIWTDSIIKDTSKWTYIKGSFIADSAYNYITLGNFFSDSLTDTLSLDCDTNVSFAYYFIDDVCVSTDSSVCGFVSTPNDTSEEDTSTADTTVSKHIFIPNAFSPNNDNHNDKFQVYGGPFKDFTMQIYNRWGELIFKTKNPIMGWNGTIGNHKAPTGVYVYYIELTLSNGKEKTYKGDLTLLR